MSLPTPVYPGVDPDADRGPTIVAVGIVFMTLVFIVLALRFFSRVYTHIETALDDWRILAATTFSWCFTILCMVGVKQAHYGQHVGKATLHDVEMFSEILYFMAITYVPALVLSRVSLLALYWRIFRVTTARRPMQIVGALNIGWGIAAGLVCIIPCVPVRSFWDSSVQGKCIDYNAFYTSNEAIAITLDLMVLFMPVYFISNLQRSLSQRISISSTFLLGMIVTVTQGLRLWRLILAQRLPGPDPTFAEVDAGLWAIAELNLWIIVASIPALRPLVNKILSAGTSRAKSSPSQRYGGSNQNSHGRTKASLGLSFFKHGKGEAPSSNSEVEDQSALKQEEVGGAGSWPEPKNQYDVRVSAPMRRESGWTPLEGGAATELEDLDGIRVKKEFEISRVKSRLQMV